MLTLILTAIAVSHITAQTQDYMREVEAKALQCKATSYTVTGVWPVISSHITCKDAVRIKRRPRK